MAIQRLAIGFILFFCASAMGETQWQVVPMVPSCGNSYFCEEADIPQQMVAAGVVFKIDRMLERAFHAKAKFYFASMTFSEIAVFDKICTLARQGLEVEGFFHHSASGPRGLGTRLEQECQQDLRKNVRVHFMGAPKGAKSGWRLHHNKFIIIDYPDQKMELAFGSANLSPQGLSVNFENWHFVRTTRDSALGRDHLCLVESMRKARLVRQSEDDPVVFRQHLDSCLSYKRLNRADVDKILENSGAFTMMAPDPHDRVFKVLRSQIEQMESDGLIQMAAYFFMHRQLVEVLHEAVRRGVKVELLVDDDIQVEGSISKQKVFYDEFLAPEKSGFSVRVFDTNESIFQLQHNKFMILHNVGAAKRTRVFTGAGQFTHSAFRNNYENFYLVQTPEVVDTVKSLFTQLWAMGTQVQ